MSNKLPISAGGLIHAKNDQGDYFLLLYSSDGKYVLPKGHLKTNESSFEAVIREIEEETGIKQDCIEVINLISRYRDATRKDDIKIVEMYYVRFKCQELPPIVSDSAHTGGIWWAFVNGEPNFDDFFYPEQAKIVLKAMKTILRDKTNRFN